MMTCTTCGDLYKLGSEHECWLLKKLDTQERLKDAPTTDFAAERPTLTDADWRARYAP